MIMSTELRLLTRTAGYTKADPLVLNFYKPRTDVPHISSFDGFMKSVNEELAELGTQGWLCGGVAFPPTDVCGPMEGELRYVFLLKREGESADLVDPKIEEPELARWDDMPQGPVTDGVTAFLSPNLHDREASPCVMNFTPASGGRWEWAAAEESTRTWVVRRINGGRALYVLNREFGAWAVYPCEGKTGIGGRLTVRENFEDAVSEAEARLVTG